MVRYSSTGRHVLCSLSLFGPHVSSLSSTRLSVQCITSILSPLSVDPAENTSPLSFHNLITDAQPQQQTTHKHNQLPLNIHLLFHPITQCTKTAYTYPSPFNPTSFPPLLLQKQHLLLNHRIILQETHRSTRPRPHICSEEPGHGHRYQSDGYRAGFCWVLLVF